MPPAVGKKTPERPEEAARYITTGDVALLTFKTRCEKILNMFTLSRSTTRRVRNPRYAPEWLESKLSPSGLAVTAPLPTADVCMQMAGDPPPPPPPDVMPVVPTGPTGPA
jgi:hypothetical protein